MSDELAGISVLVTRPSHQADNLVGLIEAHGGEALRFPTLNIEGSPDREAILSQIGDITLYDIAIFISINSVSHGVQFLPAGDKRPLIAAIGPSTSRALVDAGFKTDIKATRGFTCEALLREPALKNIEGKKIIIFRGSGGRALLGRELEERGASVTYAEVYKRDRPDELDANIEKRLAAKTVDVVTATSAETLVNLHELTEEPGVAGLLRAQLVTASERVVKKAAALGFVHPALLANAPDDDALVETILEWRRSTDQPPTQTETAAMTKQMAQEVDAGTTDAAAPAAAGAAERIPEETPEKAPPVKPAAAPRSGGGLLGLLAVLLSLAALAGSAYVWWEQRQNESDASQLLSATGTDIDSTQREIAALRGRLDEGLSRVSNLDGARGRLESRIDDLRGSVETLTARVQGAEQSIDDVRGVSASARANWVRAEAEYFLQAANSRLQLARDPDAALAALLAADDRLKSLGDPSMFRVRQELAREIEALKGVPRPDVEGIAHTLNGLATRVDELPLQNSSPDSYRSANDGEIEAQKPLDRAISTLGGVFSSMISVKRTDAEVTPLLSRDEEFFLKRNLELQLQTARLALLRADAANYRESLRTARTWLQMHFMTDAAAVQGTVTTLTQLESEEIAPRLPDISGSLRLLRLSAPAASEPAAPATDHDAVPAAEDTGDTA